MMIFFFVYRKLTLHSCNFVIKHTCSCIQYLPNRKLTELTVTRMMVCDVDEYGFSLHCAVMCDVIL